jgi:hypothetical protein
MLKKQSGMTVLGWLAVLIPVAIVVYAAIRVIPAYLNYTKVARAIEQTSEDFKGDESTPQSAILNSIEKRLDIESVSYPTMKEIAVTRDGRTWVIDAEYEEVAPLFGNLSLLLDFDKSVRVE